MTKKIHDSITKNEIPDGDPAVKITIRKKDGSKEDAYFSCYSNASIWLAGKVVGEDKKPERCNACNFVMPSVVDGLCPSCRGEKDVRKA